MPKVDVGESWFSTAVSPVAGIDDAEAVGLGIGENDEVGVVRVRVPVHAVGSESGEPLDLGYLVGCIAGIEDPRSLRARGPTD
jgi:hypothetical protein